MIEIEKTFLVTTLPKNLSSLPSTTITQGYISPSPSPLRIRRYGSKFEITKKLPLKKGDHSSAEEINIPLTEFEFNQLWPLANKSLEKIRYYFPLENNLTAEINVYQGRLLGLIMVEVEFTSEEEMNKFVPPNWFGRDITQDDFAANSFLAGKTFADIKKFL